MLASQMSQNILKNSQSDFNMTTSNLKVALFPMNIVWNDKDANLSTLRAAMIALHPETDLLILPETFSTGFPTGKDKEEVRSLAERNTGETIDRLKELAKDYNVAIAGSFIADSGGALYNRGFIIEPSGDEYFYDKHHLFSMAGENNVFSVGFGRKTIRYRGWNINLLICYDLRFPIWSRNAGNEYDLLIYVANWPKVRINAWNTLLPARAIENLSYVCGVDCSGRDDHGFEYDGSASVYDFKGKDVSVRLEGSPFVYASLDKEKLDTFRNKFPAWRDSDDFRII